MTRHLHWAAALLALAAAAPLCAVTHPRCCAAGGGDGLPGVAYFARWDPVIVIGSLSSAGNAGAPFSIEVDRVLKGPAFAGTTILVSRPVPDNFSGNYQGEHPGAAYGIWFLTPNSNGTYTFGPEPKGQACSPLQEHYAVPRGQPPAAWDAGPNAPPQDQLAEELAWSFVASGATQPAALLDVPLLLDGASPGVLHGIYETFAASTVPVEHLWGLLGLARQGDATALATIAANVVSLAATPMPTQRIFNGKSQTVVYGQENTTGAWIMQISLASISLPGPAAVTALGAILDAPGAPRGVRLGAAHALADDHSPAAIRLLAPLLASPDTHLQAWAVSGIGCFANGAPALDLRKGPEALGMNHRGPLRTRDTMDHWTMGPRNVAKHQQYYVQFWTQWWAANQALIPQS